MLSYNQLYRTRNITDYLVSKTDKLKPIPEITPFPPGYKMFNTGGVEVEVGEFLYSLVKLIKPQNVLETGTHLGVSAAYIASGLEENKQGYLYTFEVIPELLEQARALWNDVGISHYIVEQLTPSLDCQVPEGVIFDLLFLDSEPQYRFDELLTYWDMLRSGGYIVIHDLDFTMGDHGETIDRIYDWPYGDWKEKLGPLVRDFELQYIHFDNPRGCGLFQKASSRFKTTKFMKEFYGLKNI
jgi:predicted O-methyltransferase YrrM